MGDARRERLELVGAQLLHPDEASRAPEPEPGERARDQGAHRVGDDRQPSRVRPGAVGLEGHLPALVVVELDQLRERLDGLSHRGLRLGLRLGLGLDERPGLDARSHAMELALGGIETVARVRLELALAREERQLLVAPPGGLVVAHVRGQGAHPFAIALGAFAEVELDLGQGAANGGQFEHARHGVVGDFVRSLGDDGRGACPRRASGP